MCLFIFYLNSMYNFINSKNIKNIVFFSFFTALILNAKILGYIPVLIFLVLYLYNFLNTKKKLLHEKKIIFIFLTLSCFFIYVLLAYLWDNPLENLFFALKNVVKIQQDIILINYYFENITK